ncbi:probable gamma-glutamyl hydrolase 3 [Eucalyptus grandis]|uniref:probable gamma-glutamyl hydrolase 3 n=1 Tax=Eucalyptus grandis TaxID=71139 RepID=UPI00192EDB29|nr:probable gamma-glutamyl hydrolase 3 [Eucalyptus grandis]
MLKLNKVNGVLFTGGWAKTGLCYETVKAICRKVLVKNDAADHFPSYAICLGFELLTMIISKDKSILEEFNAADQADQASTLQFMRNTNVEGTVFQSKQDICMFLIGFLYSMRISIWIYNLVYDADYVAVESKYCWREKCGLHQIITDDCPGIPKVVIGIEDAWLPCIRCLLLDIVMHNHL